MLERECKDFVAATYAFKPELLQKPKFHLLLHLPQSMEDFGPAMAFNTERYMNIKSQKNIIMLYGLPACRTGYIMFICLL